ncbi:MAG: hypothetical protein JWN69_2464 [Alphaproteobacteria bacterium]|nr:hypothetical protein [Alphaproteobacteria bacterium]
MPEQLRSISKGTAMKSNLIVICAAAFASSATAHAAAVGARTIFHDAERNIEVTYDFAAKEVQFSARLPAGWSFLVNIDGDQNGSWGDGAGKPSSVHPTPDRAFGRDQNGTFCAQYILSSSPESPSGIGYSSNCDAYPSMGSVEVRQEDKQHRATFTLKVPFAEVFESRRTAHLQVCVWDTQYYTCQFTAEKPFTLRRPAVAAN